MLFKGSSVFSWCALPLQRQGPFETFKLYIFLYFTNTNEMTWASPGSASCNGMYRGGVALSSSISCCQNTEEQHRIQRRGRAWNTDLKIHLEKNIPFPFCQIKGRVTVSPHTLVTTKQTVWIEVLIERQWMIRILMHNELFIYAESLCAQMWIDCVWVFCIRPHVSCVFFHFQQGMG